MCRWINTHVSDVLYLYTCTQKSLNTNLTSLVIGSALFVRATGLLVRATGLLGRALGSFCFLAAEAGSTVI